MDSILTSIKKMLGIIEEYEHFDSEIIMYINSAFSVLTQLGVGPVEGFYISDKSSIWSDFIEDDSRLEMVKSYTYLKVKLLFDPPLGGSLIDAMNRQLDEYEWRINIIADNPKEEEYYKKEIELMKEDIELLKKHDLLSVSLDNGGGNQNG